MSYHIEKKENIRIVGIMFRLLFLMDGRFFLRLFSGARLLFQLAADRGAALAPLFGTVLAGQDGDLSLIHSEMCIRDRERTANRSSSV